MVSNRLESPLKELLSYSDPGTATGLVNKPDTLIQSLLTCTNSPALQLLRGEVRTIILAISKLQSSDILEIVKLCTLLGN